MPLSHRCIEAGIYVLLVYPLLAFGGAHQGAVALIELICGGLFLIWLILAFRRLKQGGAYRELPSYFSFFPIWRFVSIAGAVLFLLLLWVQRISFPAFLVKIMSPATHALYLEAASTMQGALPDWLPLSVCSQATEDEFSRLLAYAMLFFLILSAVRTQRQVNRLIQLIFLLGCFEALLGIFQLLSGFTTFNWNSSQGSWSHGTFINKNHFAGYLEMVIPLSLGMFLTHFERTGHSRPSFSVRLFRETYPKAFLLLLAMLGMVCALLLSGSRGGIMSFCGGMALFTLIASRRRLLRKWSIALLLTVILAGGITVLLGPGTIQKRLQTVTRFDAEPSFQVRWELWRSAIHIFRDYPVFGSGGGTFAHLHQRYRTFREKLREYPYPENDYAQLLAETGIVGAFLACVSATAFFVQLLSAWTQRHSRWSVALGAGCMGSLWTLMLHSWGDFNLHIPSNAILFTVIAALGVVIVHIHRVRVRPPHVSDEHAPLAALPVAAAEESALRRRSRFWIIAGMLIFAGVYVGEVSASYYAFLCYHDSAPRKENHTNQRASLELLRKAVFYDKNHGEYVSLLGKMLAASASVEQPPAKSKEAEIRLREAVLLDPANPWYYYEAGRLSHQQEDCQEDCQTARYFTAALNNAPRELFLRQAVGRWFFHYSWDMGKPLLRNLFLSDPSETPEPPRLVQEMSTLYYDLRLDYESDHEILRRQSPESEGLKRCEANILYKNPEETLLEFGSDNGFAEWKTPLLSETDRIKKVLCLPDNLAYYKKAAVRIFMNHAGDTDFTISIHLDDRRLAYDAALLTRTAAWHDIQLDPQQLHGKTAVTLYIRVNGTSLKHGNYLHVWGESRTVNSSSVYRVDSTTDLSPDEGIQHGEFLVRLKLER